MYPNKVRLKKDIVIPAGTILEKGPIRRDFGDGVYMHTIGIGKDNTADLTMFWESDEETAEWIEPVKTQRTIKRPRGQVRAIERIKRDVRQAKKRTVKAPPKHLKTTVSRRQAQVAVKAVAKRRELRFVQLLNPSSSRYVKVDKGTGRIVAHKKSPGPYAGIEIVRGAAR